MAHVPVLLEEVIELLDLKPGDNVIDGTLGNGGHAKAILEKTAPDGQLLGIDLDPDALKEAEQTLKVFHKRTQITAGNYVDMEEVATEQHFSNIRGILLDLGIRSDQLEHSGRGFSFKKDEPLLMTFSDSADITAKDLVNDLSKSELTTLIRKYGEERHAKQISRAIVLARKKEKIDTTSVLVELIKGAVPAPYRRARIHSATRTFQALRIAVNKELEVLERGLKTAMNLLEPGGRLAVISFHSLEDRIVKRTFQDFAKKGKCKIITKRPKTPQQKEQKQNPRSRSAKLRVCEKQKYEKVSAHI